MEKFAGYGFNKSHAAAYALVAYQTAYFKAHHPAAFMAANLSAVMDDTDKVQRFYEDAIALTGSRCCRPTSTAANYRFVPVDAQAIRYGLGAIKGTGESAIDAIVRGARGRRPVPRPVRFLRARRQAHRQPARDRGAGPCRRIRCASTTDRAALLASVGIALEAAEQRERNALQVSLFGDAGDAASTSARRLSQRRRWDERRLLKRGESEPRILSFRPSLQRLPRRGAALRTHYAEGTAARRKRRIPAKEPDSSPVWSNRCASRERRAGAW